MQRPSSLTLAWTTLLVTVLGLVPLRILGVEHPLTTGKALQGYERQSVESQLALEAQFDRQLQKENLRDWLKRLTARPHHVGSPFGKEVAEFIAAQFRSWGFDTVIEQFDVLFPTPKTRLLEMTAPEPFTADLAEPAVEGDATSSQTKDYLPSYNAYSIDGDVTGELVYVNYGLPKDYELLAERGISVKGKIVIARYGGAWRGLKPKVAAQQGAVGCLIYSDPAEEGYREGDVYPKGPWRNDYGVQRGSVADIPVAPGDPLTPGIGATKDAQRLSVQAATTLTKIPVLPISSADALPLLRALGGPIAPDPWRGALPIPYHLGSGPAKVHLRLEFDWPIVPAYDVIAKLPGADRPEQWIIRGNHHDAWVFGAEDPVSGLVALMEEARAIGELAKGGWKPKRTIVFAAWDAEEPGLLGSTEWVETHRDLLRAHAVAYLNSDNNQRGFLSMGGSHSLERFVSEIARDVVDPQTKVSVGERLRARSILFGTGDDRRELRERKDLRLRALGSGSDFTPFLQHLGIAALDLRYGGEGDGGSYHSAYDSYEHYTRFIDPGFDYGVALAKTAGRATLRLANADVLPLEFGNVAQTLSRYVSEVVKLSDTLREEATEFNRLLEDRTFQLAADPTQTFIPPTPKTPVPFLNFAPLQNAVAQVRDAARNFESERIKAGERGLSRSTQQNLDRLFMGIERVLTRDEGLPRRPWYKHLVYAPGYYTGYGVKTLPGVREAIEERHWSDVNDQIEIVAKAFERYADQLESGRRILAQNHPE